MDAAASETAGNAATARIAGLRGEATLTRDAWGIPHIHAADVEDAFLLNGWVHAEDRMWQMEAALRRAIGRFAEWGGPAAAAADRLARQLGVEAASRRDYEALNAETKMMAGRYAEGVNAWIDAGGTAPEYDLLGEKPMRWEPWFCVAVMRQRGILMGSIWFKLWRAAALDVVGPEAVGLLRYDDNGPERFIMPQGESGSRLAADLAALRPAVEALSDFAPSDGTVAGSNNWAVSGSRTLSGKPLVAGDPHRAYEIPGMYTQLHLACPDFDAIGFAVPGVPAFPHFCHTDNVAWCVTHAFADIHDLYVETFTDGGARYATEDGEAEATLRQETIAVRGAPDETITVTETRHGPVIAGDPRTGKALALKSVQLFDTDHAIDCLLPMLKAATLDDFYDRCEGWGVIDHNLVGADREGHVGVLVRAVVPERDRANGWLPMPGWTGEHEWRGMIPFERMPRELDPEDGHVVTANNRLVPEDHPDYLLTDCHPSTRADRVTERLENLRQARVGDMIDILRDTDSAPARAITARILAAPVDGAAAGLAKMLAGWDGRMDMGLSAPTAYILIRQEMTRILLRRSGLEATVKHPATQPAPGVPPLVQLWWTLPTLLRDGNETLLDGATWDEVMAEALETVAAGPAPGPWGEAHLPLFVHPLAHLFPDDPRAAAPETNPIGGDGDCVCATGCFAMTGPRSFTGSVARYVFDLGDWDNSRWVVFHGTSGHPGDPHYSDQNPLWARGDMVPMPFSRDAVAAHAVSVTTLTPAAA